MIQDESQSEQAPSNQQNPLAGLMKQPAPQNTNITKQQLIAGLHHLNAFKTEFSPLLQNPKLGKGNIRPTIFERAATLIGSGIFTVPEVINGTKDLPDDPIEQKKWLETKLVNASLAEQKLIHDYIAQGPGPEAQGPEWSMDNHKDHMTGLLGNYKRG